MNAFTGITFVLFLLGLGLGYIFSELRQRRSQPQTERNFRSEMPANQNLERQAALLAGVRDAVIVVGTNRLVVDWNEAAERLYGFTHDEAIGQEFTELIHSEMTPDELQAATQEVIQNGFWRGAAVHHTKVGKRIVVDVTSSFVRDAQGKPIALIGINRDITNQVRTEALFKDLFANNPLPMSVYDRTTLIYLDVNTAMIAKYGYSREEFLAMPITQICPEAEVPRLLESVNTTASGLMNLGEWKHRLKDGRLIDVELTRNTLSYNGHDAALIVIQDITERKQTERALRESEERFRALIENGQDMIGVATTNGIISYASPSVERILGYQPNELIGLYSYALIYPDDKRRTRDVFLQTTRDGLGRYVEVRMKHKEGSWRTIEMIGTPAFDSPAVNGMVINARDITSHKVAEEALRDTGEKLGALIQAAPLAVVALDLDGNITLWNPAAERIFGWTETEVIGRPNPIVPEDDYEDFIETNERALHGELFEQLEVTRRRRDGTLVDVSLSTALLRDAKGHISGTIAMMADITPQRRAQRKLLQQNEYLAALHETSVALTNRLSVDELLETIVLRAGALLDTPDGFLYLVDPIEGNLMLSVGVGFYRSHIGLRVGYGAGLVGQVWQSGQPLAVDRYNEWAGRLANPAFDQIHSIAGIPLKSEDQVVGVVGLTRFKPGWAFSSNEMALLERFAELASVALEGTRLYIAAQQELTERKRAEQQLLHQNEYLTALHETTLALVNRLESGDLLEAIIMRAGTLLGTPDGFVYLVSSDQSQMIGRVGVGRLRRFLGRSIQRGEGLNGRVWETGVPMAVNNYVDWSNRQPEPEFDEFHALVSVPLHSGGQVLGALSLAYFDEGRSFGPDEIAILSQFAELASIVLDNANLFSSAQQELAERKRAEEKLRQLNAELEMRVQRRTAELQQRQAQLRAVLDAAGEGVIYSEQSHIRYTNQAMAELTGYQVEELIGQPNAIFKSDHATQEQSRRFVEQFTEPGITWRGEQPWRRKDGTDFEAALTVRLLENTGSQSDGAVTVVRDITAEKQLQAQKAEFIANASHELRTPLTNFKTRLYLMRRQPDRIEEHMTVLERVTERMVNLVEDLLDVSRFERGVIPINHQDVVLQELVGDVTHTLQPEAQNKCLSLTTDLPTSALHIQGDPNRLTQVFVNLIVNAINYTSENGYVRVHLFEENGEAILHVQDTGIGIRPENLKRVFEPFFRANEGTARGTGLGLSISRQIIQLHAGTLTVESLSGKGSTFIVRLPLNNSVDKHLSE